MLPIPVAVLGEDNVKVGVSIDALAGFQLNQSSAELVHIISQKHKGALDRGKFAFTISVGNRMRSMFSLRSKGVDGV